jgi:RNA polymerase sigma-54 factor
MRHEHQLREELRLVPSPKLIQFLTLLQMPTVELEQLIRRELESNPVLEEAAEPAKEKSDSEESTEEYSSAELLGYDVLPQPSAPAGDGYDLLENVPAPMSKLGEELLRQARSVFGPDQLRIAEFVIGNLTDDGFLLLGDEEIATTVGAPVGDVVNVVELIGHFNPVGCARRSLRESFLSQLEEQGYDAECVEYLMVRDHFDDLTGSRRKNMLKSLGITAERCGEALKVIGGLEMRPGRKFFTPPPGYVNPDFTVQWQDGKLWAAYNDDYLPRVRLRPKYVEMMRNPEGFADDELKFMRKKVKSAHLFLTAIEQRRLTLNRIINRILEYQDEFFEKGYEFLKPMTMTELAAKLGVNVSTVSRAIQGKYVESPWGIHELKFFFSAAVCDMDKRLILTKIREYIDGEDKSRPLSDQEITRRLGREGITISRRTVTKYREALGIGPHLNRVQI